VFCFRALTKDPSEEQKLYCERYGRGTIASWVSLGARSTAGIVENTR
jgi:hypothetical protein